MTTQLHIAAQYLAAAAINFIPKKEDDSHTNLGYFAESKTLSTRLLDSKEIILSLNYDLFALEWLNDGVKTTLQLDKTSHLQILQWIKKMAQNSGIQTPYNYDFHYELPYAINNDYIFKLEGINRLKELASYRSLAQDTIKEFLEKNHLTSEIRVWPHHFDTGAFTTLDKKTAVSIGLGLAIPDQMCNDYYFYISGYKGHEGLHTDKFSSLTLGKWYTQGFKGAILPISKMNKKNGVTFFDEALSNYRNTYQN